MTYEDFRNQLCAELARTKSGEFTPWMVNVGYRPDDKDMGFSRWRELYSPPVAEQGELNLE